MQIFGECGKAGRLCVASGLCVANPVRSAAVCACTVVVV